MPIPGWIWGEQYLMNAIWLHFVARNMESNKYMKLYVLCSQLEPF